MNKLTIHTNTDNNISNALIRTPGAIATAAENIATDPTSYIPQGWIWKLGKLVYVGAKVAKAGGFEALAIKDAAEAAAKARTAVPVAPDRLSTAIADENIPATPTPTPTVTQPISQAINTNPIPVAPTPQEAAATAAATAQGVHDATISGQLHLFPHPDGTTTTVTHTLHDATDPEVVPHETPHYVEPAPAPTIKHKDFAEPVTAARIEAHVSSLEDQMRKNTKRIQGYTTKWRPAAVAKQDTRLISDMDKTIAKLHADNSKAAADIAYSLKTKLKIPGEVHLPDPAVTPMGIVAGDDKNDIVLEAMKKQHEQAMSRYSEAHAKVKADDSLTPAAYNSQMELVDRLGAHADNLKKQIDEYHLTIPQEVTAAASHVTKDEIAATAKSHIATGTAKKVTAAERKAAKATETGAATSPVRDKYFSKGRPNFNPRRNKNGTIYKGPEEEHTLAHSTQDMAKAYAQATKAATVEAKAQHIVEPDARHALMHEMISKYLDKYKADSQALGHDPQMGAQVSGPGAVSHKPDAYKLYPSDVYHTAVKHEKNKFFNNAESPHMALTKAIPQDVQLTAAVHALDMEKVGITDATKVAHIVKAMKRVTEQGIANGSKLQGTSTYASFARAMLAGVDDLKQLAAENLSKIVYKEKADTEALTSEATAAFDQHMTGDAATRTSQIAALSDPGKFVTDAAQAAGGTSPAAQKAAAAGLAQHVAQSGVTNIDMDIAKSAAQNAKDAKSTGVRNNKPAPKAKAAAKSRAVKDHKAMNKSADDTIIPGLDKTDRQAVQGAIDLGYSKSPAYSDLIGYRTNRRALYAVGTTLERWVANNPVYVARDALRKAKSVFMMKHLEYNETAAKALQSIGGTNQFKRDTIRIATNAWQTGTDINKAANPAAYDFLHTWLLGKDPNAGLISRLFEGPKGDVTQHGALSHMPSDFEELNKVLDMNHVKKDLRFDSSKVDKTQPLADQVQELYGQVHHWDFGDDPVGELAKINTASLMSKQWNDFAKDAVDNFGSGHQVDKDWVQVTNTRANPEQRFTQHLPEGVWFHKDIAHQLGALEYDIRKTAGFTGPNKMGQFVMQTVDPVFNLFRKNQTVLRLSSSLRNEMGDYFSTALVDNKWSPKYTVNALKMMHSMGQLDDGGLFHISRTLEGANVGGTKNFLHINLKGKPTQSFSIAEANQMAMQDGMVGSSHPADEVYQEVFGAPKSKQLIGVAANKISNTKPVRTLTRVADKQGTLSRMTQYDALMRDSKWQSKFDNLKDLRQATASRVRATHPDPEGLTNFERKYVKRVMGYYTWQRSMIVPTLLSMAANPRSLVIFPQMLLMLNKIAGSDPQSVGNQWSNQVNRPAYETDNPFGAYGNIGGIAGKFIGNGGKPLTADLNTPTESMFGSSGLLTGDSLGHALGNLGTKAVAALSPLVRAPFELASGTEFRDTGPSKIKDKGEYIDSLIPGINELSNDTGYSFSNTVANALTPAREVSNDPRPSSQWRLAPQQAVISGQKKPIFNTSMLNNFVPFRVGDPNTTAAAQQAMREMLDRQGWGSQKK